jgi:hypothetical protein
MTPMMKVRQDLEGFFLNSLFILNDLKKFHILFQGVRTDRRSAQAKQIEFLPDSLFTLDRNSKNETSEFAGIKKHSSHSAPDNILTSVRFQRKRVIEGKSV